MIPDGNKDLNKGMGAPETVTLGKYIGSFSYYLNLFKR